MKNSGIALIVIASMSAIVSATPVRAFSWVFSPSSSNHAYAPPNPNAGNSAVIIQPPSGTGNTSTITQSGKGSHAFSYQSGSNNTSTITQSTNGGSQTAINISIGGSGNKQGIVQKQ